MQPQLDRSRAGRAAQRAAERLTPLDGEGFFSWYSTGLPEERSNLLGLD